MQQCLFCKIVKGEIPCKKIYESSDAIAFLDINPCSPGHTLVIPKKHYIDLQDTPEADLSAIFNVVSTLSKKIKDAMNNQGFNIGINDGAVAGQEVQHLHIHIIPRYTGDHGMPIQGLVRIGIKESLETIAEKIKGQIKEEKPKWREMDF